MRIQSMGRGSAVAVLLALSVRAETPLGTEFTYQGRLASQGQPVNGPIDFSFALWDAAANGNAVGNPVPLSNVAVQNGLFTVELDFGAGVFTGNARWLEVGVRPGNSGAGVPYTPLAPRQPVTAVPYALHAPGVGLSLPYSGSFSGTDQTAFAVAQTGLGYAAHFSSNNAANYWGILGVTGATTGPSLFATNSSGATVARFQNTGVANSVPTVLSTTIGDGAGLYGSAGVGTNGTGVVGSGQGTGNGIRGLVSGSGNAIYGSVTGNDGRAGLFQITSQFNGQNAVEIETNGNSNSQALYARHTGAGDCGLFEIANPASGAEAVESRTNGSGDAVQAINTGTGRAGYFEVSNAASNATALYCTTNGTGLALNANGIARVKILEILGGSDMSEGFDVSGADLQPGMVVAIDPATPGQLKPTATAYDSKVAGIIAGAGGVRPGMMMKQEGSIADGKYPVALSGRVFCLADATAGAIEPGDLLVSSDVAGHAMKAVNRDRAQGAVLGKAMTGLPSGERGLVLVLVSLQ